MEGGLKVKERSRDEDEGGELSRREEDGRLMDFGERGEELKS